MKAKANVSFLGRRRMASAPRNTAPDRGVRMSIHPTARKGDSRLNAVVGSDLLRTLKLNPGDPVDLRFNDTYSRATLVRPQADEPATKLYMRGSKGRVAIRLPTRKGVKVPSQAASVASAGADGVTVRVPAAVQKGLRRAARDARL